MIDTLCSTDCSIFTEKLNFKYQEGWDILSCGLSDGVWWAILQNDKEYKSSTELCGGRKNENCN